MAGDLLPAEDHEQVLEAITALVTYYYTCTHELKGHNMQHSGPTGHFF